AKRYKPGAVTIRSPQTSVHRSSGMGLPGSVVVIVGGGLAGFGGAGAPRRGGGPAPVFPRPPPLARGPREGGAGGGSVSFWPAPVVRAWRGGRGTACAWSGDRRRTSRPKRRTRDLRWCQTHTARRLLVTPDNWSLRHVRKT